MTWDFKDKNWPVLRMWKTNLPQEMGLPRWEVAGNKMGRRIYHRRWDFQDGKWQEMGKTNLPQEMGRPKWEVAGNEMGRRNLPQEMGRPRWEVAGKEMERRIYHRRWDVQDGKWQVIKWEDEFTT